MHNKIPYFVYVCLVVITLNIIYETLATNSAPSEYERNIVFRFYHNNSVVHESSSASDDLTSMCEPQQPWLIVVPGWTDNCTAATAWVPKVIEKFTKHRGGCIVCMDYYAYSWDPSLFGYVNLTTHFDGISRVLTDKLRQFERQTFDPDRGYMFSMSYGSRLAINSGRDFGGKLWGLDACDPAGPMFYPNPAMQARGSARLAARNVQIIHTSVDEGTFERDGHQDWLMGDCGINQAATPPNNETRSYFQVAAKHIPFYVPLLRENHSMCPWLYISAFEHVFAAVANRCCPPSVRDAWPKNYRMGYMQPTKGQVVQKTLFAKTYKQPPYNAP